jgi:hypothetical protein
MPPENNPRAWPLAVAIYGHDVHVVSDPAMLDRELVVHDRASNEGARFDARRTPRSAELAGSGVLCYGELTVDPRTRWERRSDLAPLRRFELAPSPSDWRLTV